MTKLKIGIIASGRGSNLQAIIDNIKSGRLDAQVNVVICDKANAYALERAKKAGIPTVSILRADYADKNAFEQAIIDCLKVYNVHLVVLAGFMRIISQTFIRQFPNRIINIHPALLPSFPGLHAQQQAINYGAKLSGCTVHFVDEGMDTGPIIMQKAVDVDSDDNEASLAEKILTCEHELYSKVLQLYAEGRIEVVGRKVVIRK